jgi:Flp pilus assembly protein TadG
MSNWKKDEDGGTLVFVGVCLTVLLGFAALTFDVGRVAATQSDMQAFADHVALAAAGELDGKTDAIVRATAAADDLIQDRQTFATGPQALGGNTDFTLRFLSGLPNTDRAYFDPTDDLSSFETTDATEATLVEVTTAQRTVFLPFFRAFSVLTGNEPSDGTVGARAVAGFTQYACDVTTLMFCLPPEPLFEGQSILLRSGGQGTAWGAGDFGFVDPSSFEVDPNGPCAGLSGVNLDVCLIAASGNRTACFAQRGIDLEPGQKVGITNAVFNTRFDMFNGVLSNKKNDPAYAPGPHVVSGLTSTGGGQCLANNTEPSPDTMAFPPDDCFGSALGCPNGGGRFGDGNWNNGRDDYVDINYGTPSGTAGTTDPFAGASTRFEYYKEEIASAGEDGPILTDRSEDGRAQCSQHRSDNVNRRVFIAAAIDCAANTINGAATNVPVEQYFEVFLLRPVGEGTGSPATFDLHVEVIGPAGGDGAGNANDAGIFRNVVELYR